MNSNGVSYEVEKVGEEGVLKCHHRKLRRYHLLPWYLKKHLNEDEVSCEVVTKEINNNNGVGLIGLPVLLSTESEESSFEGFDIQEQRVQVEMRQNKGTLLPGKNLIEFPCTERVVEEPLQSTKVDEGKCFGEFLVDEMEVSNTFHILEQSILIQEEVLEGTEALLSQLWSDLSGSDRGLNDQVGSRGFSLLGMSCQSDVQEDSFRQHEDRIENKQGLSTGGELEENSRISSEEGVDKEGEVLEVCGVANATQENSAEFAGFSQNENSLNALAKLNDMRELINVSRRNLMAGRTRSQGLRRQLMEYREIQSFNVSEAASLGGDVSQEIRDYLTELPPRAASTPRVLRSRGPVKDLPNVQSGILEYKLKKLKL